MIHLIINPSLNQHDTRLMKKSSPEHSTIVSLHFTEKIKWRNSTISLIFNLWIWSAPDQTVVLLFVRCINKWDMNCLIFHNFPTQNFEHRNYTSNDSLHKIIHIKQESCISFPFFLTKNLVFLYTVQVLHTQNFILTCHGYKGT